MQEKRCSYPLFERGHNSHLLDSILLIKNKYQNVLATDPLYKVTSYIDGGAISYKLNYKF